jgi:small subunit ribosomal protein S2
MGSCESADYLLEFPKALIFGLFGELIIFKMADSTVASETKKESDNLLITGMFESGSHFGYSRSRRHPSMAGLMFGMKNRVEIFDLEKTKAYLEAAKEFAKSLGLAGKQLLLVASKNEARLAIRSAAETIGMPYVAGRWIGGTMTNFGVIRGRVNKLIDLVAKREKGELAKYTKKERLMIDREIESLEEMFSGLLAMKEIPAALFVIDSGKERTAISEAHKMGVPIIALLNSDCDLKAAKYPIPANDSSVASIRFIVNEISEAYRQGMAARPAAASVTKPK